MKKFIKHILTFSIVTIFVIALLVFATTVFTKKSFDYKISENKNILIVGDSHTESAINDTIFKNAYNLSQSGSAYFYSFLKAREVINHNSQIDTLIVSYSYDSLDKEKDAWITGSEKLRFKIRDHLFLFNSTDYRELLMANPKLVLVYTPQVIAHNFKILMRGLPAVGGFDYLKRDKLQEDLIRLNNKDTENETVSYSKYQEYYLLKIYNLCKEKNLKLILINTPIHPVALEDISAYKNYYCEFFTKNMQGATLINNANFKIPDSGFADAHHLDYEGAKIYTEYLKQTKLKQDLQFCN